MTKHISKLIGSAVALTLVVSLMSTSANAQTQQPSSKVTAKTANLTLIPEVVVQSPATEPVTSDWQPVLFNYIKTANQKDLFISASLQAGLYTETLVKSKQMIEDTSVAKAEVKVRVLIDDIVAKPVEPGEVVYAYRSQTLSAKLEGAIAGCITVDPVTGTIIINWDCVTPEEIKLILETLNAASFSFVAVDVPQGVHKISVEACVSAGGSAQTGSYKAKALVGKGSVTVESVRLIKDPNVVLEVD